MSWIDTLFGGGRRFVLISLTFLVIYLAAYRGLSFVDIKDIVLMVFAFYFGQHIEKQLQNQNQIKPTMQSTGTTSLEKKVEQETAKAVTTVQKINRDALESIEKKYDKRIKVLEDECKRYKLQAERGRQNV